mgnify:CR=1 FL=1
MVGEFAGGRDVLVDAAVHEQGRPRILPQMQAADRTQFVEFLDEGGAPYRDALTPTTSKRCLESVPW